MDVFAMNEFDVDEGWRFYDDWRKYGFYGFVKNDARKDDDYFVPSWLRLDLKFAGCAWTTLLSNTQKYIETGVKDKCVLTDILMIPADAPAENFKPFMEKLLPKVRALYGESNIFATKYPEKIMRNDPSTNELMELCLAADGMTMAEYYEKVTAALDKIQGTDVKEVGNWASPF